MTIFVKTSGPYEPGYMSEIQQYAQSIMDYFFPSHRNQNKHYDVMLSLETMIGGLMVGGTHEITPGEIDISIAFYYAGPDGVLIQNREQVLLTVAHECVHAKQIINGDSYNEDEALALERQLYEEFWPLENYLKFRDLK